MCGFNGIFAYNNAANVIDREELTRTRDYMAARGPDGKGEWVSADARVGFGHRRLSIIDLSDAAAQPMTNANRTLVVTFNGEIYNYRELRRDLEAKGYVCRSNSDTEVLLHLYTEKGEEMVHDLRGMFAFAIWDEVRQGLFFARDIYGIKPLYISNDGWTFRFASQVKALLAGGAVSRDPEPAGTVGFYLFGSVPEPFTLYRDIRALPAGHTQWVDRFGPREPKAYTSISAILTEGARKPVPAAELGERLRPAVRDSVRAHLLADVEVGLFLSAGIDSGALMGVLRDVSGRNVQAITLAFDEFSNSPKDEVPLATQVAAHYGAKHVVRHVGENEFKNDLPAIFEAMDQPSIDGVNTWFVSKAAKEAGLKVAISGLGGDELLAGYPSFTDVPRWHKRSGPVARIPGVGIVARKLMSVLAPSLTREHPKAVGMLEFAGSWAGAYLLRRGLYLPHELPAFLGKQNVHEGLRRLRPLERLSRCLLPDPRSDMGRVCALESSQYMRNQLLRDADWAGMAHSVEIRVPLVDVQLLRTVAPLIPTLKPGTGKSALAHTPSRPLLDEITKRAKSGFEVPTGAWIENAAHANRTPQVTGIVSRRWARTVLDGTASDVKNARCAA